MADVPVPGEELTPDAGLPVDPAPALPAAVQDLLERLWSAGHAAYVVGGSLRDTMIGREPDDWDLTTSARPEETAALFPQAVYENAFGSVVVPSGDEAIGDVDITTMRSDHDYADFRRPHRVDRALAIGRRRRVHHSRLIWTASPSGSSTSMIGPMAPPSRAARTRAACSPPRPGTMRSADSATDSGTRRLTTVRPSSSTRIRSWRGPAPSTRPEVGPGAGGVGGRGAAALVVNRPPEHLASVGTTVQLARWSGSVAASYVDEAFWADVLDARFWGTTEAYTTVDVSIARKLIGDRLECVVAATNVFDERVQQHIYGDLVGRKAAVELRARF